MTAAASGGSFIPALLVLLAVTAGSGQADLAKLNLPEGFEIRVVTDQVTNARQMALAADGTLYVGSWSEGKVYAVPRALGSERPDAIVLAEGLPLPSGVAERGGDLYVAALNRVLRFPAIGERLARIRHQVPDADAGAAYEVITDRLPDIRHHGWKYLKFGPDGHLYLPVGAPCNLCISEDPRFATILRMDPRNGNTEILARGVRNSVGFAWHPRTRQLWFTDNGRDLLGDDVPPEEVNVLTATGQHFGYPHVHGANILDPEFGTDADPADYAAPVVEIQAHSAALGIDFYTGSQFPERYSHALFIAEHGSWNRSGKVGYQVSALVFDGDEPNYEPFVTGWLEGQVNWGRPSDVLVAPDGSLLIAEDQKGVIYQVTWSG